MNKSELVSAVADKANVSKKTSEEVVSAVFDVLTEALGNGDKVAVAGFGTFEVHERAERTGRNPQTGEEIHIDGCKSPAFKAGKQLKEAVNK